MGDRFRSSPQSEEFVLDDFRSRHDGRDPNPDEVRQLGQVVDAFERLDPEIQEDMIKEQRERRMD